MTSTRAQKLYLLAGGAALAAAAVLAAPPPGEDPRGDLPPEFRQIIPRGRIASIDDPQFVAAADAEISPEAWVFGVEIEGEARAYDLNLLNHHEIVNDRLGGRAISAVW